MGKTVKIIAAITLVLLFIPISGEWFKYLGYLFDGEESSVKELKFRELTSSTAEVVGLQGPPGSDIIIPSKVMIGMRVHTVTTIGNKAFSECFDLESVNFILLNIDQ